MIGRMSRLKRTSACVVNPQAKVSSRIAQASRPARWKNRFPSIESKYTPAAGVRECTELGKGGEAVENQTAGDLVRAMKASDGNERTLEVPEVQLSIPQSLRSQARNFFHQLVVEYESCSRTGIAVMSPPLKKLLSWSAVAASGLIAVLALVRLGSDPVSRSGLDGEQFVSLGALGVAALVHLVAAICVMLSRRQLAALVLLASVPVFSAWAIHFRACSVLNPSDRGLYHAFGLLAVLSASLCACWLFSSRRQWPPVLPSSYSARARVSIVCSFIALAGASDLVITLIQAIRPSPPAAIDCNVAGVFSQSTFLRDTAFTAHVILVGHQVKVSNRWGGYWAVVTVQEQLVGWHLPRLALLTDGFFRSGDNYFVDGRRSKGLFTRFLPIVAIGICNRTALISDSGIPLRLIRSGFPKKDVRIVGRVDRLLDKTLRKFYERSEFRPIQGALVAITGPSGTTIASTDQDGIYDVAGLSPGRYSVHLQSQIGLQNVIALSNWQCDLKPGEVATYSFSFR